jgi:hypothetical protein
LSSKEMVHFRFSLEERRVHKNKTIFLKKLKCFLIVGFGLILLKNLNCLDQHVIKRKRTGSGYSPRNP